MNQPLSSQKFAVSRRLVNIQQLAVYLGRTDYLPVLSETTGKMREGKAIRWLRSLRYEESIPYLKMGASGGGALMFDLDEIDGWLKRKRRPALSDDEIRRRAAKVARRRRASSENNVPAPLQSHGCDCNPSETQGAGPG